MIEYIFTFPYTKEVVTMFKKKSTILFCIFVFIINLSFLITNPAHAAPLVNFPVTVTQPDGTKLNLFASGDEFYNWLHDADGYTVMQHPTSGYYVYADLIHSELVPTRYVVGKVDPANVGLSPDLNVSSEKMEQIRQERIARTSTAAGVIRYAPTTGTINNLVVFIRFAGESEFTDATTTYTNMLNDSTAGANSMVNYYTEVSYSTLTVDSTVYPTPPGSTIVSFQDSHTRGYFQPYNVATNPIGYSNDAESTLREHALLRDAVAYVNSLGQFPSGALIDGDNDGDVDGITFVIKGNPDGWNDLLWPHMWVLYSYDVKIDGKQVGTYSFHLQNHLKASGVGVLAHEMFHALGAPDLYHYSQDSLTPVGSWDVMEATANPPQHMGCYMKATYGDWISSIPELSSTGTYALNPLTSSTDNCYKIASPYSTDEYFVVEYRQKTGTFESSIPGTGILVYRINTTVAPSGNRNGPPDEVYIYRPGGTTIVNGNVNTANFSSNVGRTAINDVTNPSSFLSDGSAGGLNLCNIGASGSTISFDICAGSGYAISGNAGVGGATLSYTDGISKTASANGSGLYTFVVPSGWSGTVTPSKTGYTFTPPSRSYTNVLANQTGQDYTATGPINLLQDPSFEAYTPNAYWTETSTNFGTPLCTVADCGNGSGNAGPQTGSVWGWFGGTSNDESASLSQTVNIPIGSTTFEFYLWIGFAETGSDAGDIFTAKIDGVTVFSANATQIGSYATYTLVSVDVSAYADDALHTVMFSVVTNGQSVNFNLDDVALLSAPPSTEYTISGDAGVGDATLSYTDGTPKFATADGGGLYSFMVPSGWSGTVTPSKTGYTFSPVSRSYGNVLADQVDQNYTATPTTTYMVYVPLILRNFASTPPGDFNKTAPINGATSQPANPTLSWGTSSDSTSYEYCYDTSNDNACTTWTSTAASTSVGLSGLSPSTSYYWQVRANNTSGTTYANGGSTNYWSFTTAALPVGIVNGDFESGSTGWTEFSTHGWEIIVNSFPPGVTARSGSYAAWLGGDIDDISLVQQQVTISAGAPYLVYWHWIASSDFCGYDFGGVMIDSSVVDVYDLCTTTNTGGWVQHSVNLSAYVGQSVTLQIRAETDSSVNSNLFVDDVSLQASASASGRINGVVPNLDASSTQGKIGIFVQGVKPQGINEKRLLNPR